MPLVQPLVAWFSPRVNVVTGFRWCRVFYPPKRAKHPAIKISQEFKRDPQFICLIITIMTGNKNVYWRIKLRPRCQVAVAPPSLFISLAPSNSSASVAELIHQRAKPLFITWYFGSSPITCCYFMPEARGKLLRSTVFPVLNTNYLFNNCQLI